MFDTSAIINNLAGLLVFTSLMVVICKKATTSALIYSVQSAVLVLVFISIGHMTGAGELYTWAATAVFTKVVLVPLIMYSTLSKLHDPEAGGTIISSAVLILLTTLIMILFFFVANSVEIPIIRRHGLEPLLAVSLGHFMIGVMCIVSQRNIMKQIFGYCLMENGAHLTLALMANQAPHLVEIGITTDAIFAVIVMVYMARRIYATIHTLNAQDLTALKG
ncbi:MAG: hydrogenase 4 membrane subunit [Deltaproteobacteria bacterium]|jgi:hydrogenase-4 component E|nr:hydrogenase 4 membrane subunit [Deltaproteobacteria bacterium]